MIETVARPRTERFALPQVLPNPVSMVLMQTYVEGEFNVDPALAAASDWIVTFPTMHHYVANGVPVSFSAPFRTRFSDAGRATEFFGVKAFRRDGNAYRSVATQCAPNALCAERSVGNSVNVIGFSSGDESLRPSTAITGSAFGEVATGLVVIESAAIGEWAGWSRLTLGLGPADAAQSQTDAALPPDLGPNTSPGLPLGRMVGPTTGLRYAGLPAIGVALTRYTNAAARPGVRATFGGDTRLRGALLTDPPSR